MRVTLEAARKDLARHMKDPAALAVWVGLPLVIGLLMALVAGGGDGPPEAKVLLVDRDDTVVSGLLGRALDQAGIFDVTAVSEEEGRATLDDGDATAMVVVPPGFQSAVLHDRPCTLLVTSNPSQRILPAIVVESLDVLGEGVFYAHRILGDEVRQIIDAGEAGDVPEDEIARISVAIDRVVRRVKNHLLPPAFEIETVDIEEDGSVAVGGGPTFVQLVLPGVLLLSLLFMAQGLSEDIWREKAQGTLRRAAGVPAGLGAIVRGKVLAGAVMMAGVAVVYLLVGLPFTGLPLKSLPLAAAWSALAGAALLALMLLIQVHVSSQRAGSITTNSLVFPLMMLGGSLFPLEAMPAWMAAAGRVTPNGYALEVLKGILLGSAGPAVIGAGFAAAALTCALTVSLVQRRVHRRFAGN